MNRSTRSLITFHHSFLLDGIDDVQPPGDYLFDIDEEEIEGLSFLAFRRIAVLMHLPAVSEAQASSQVLSIPPSALDALIGTDRAMAGLPALCTP